MLKFILISRIGSGKKMFLKQLHDNNIKIASSHTNRKQNTDDENDIFHHFENNADFENIKNNETSVLATSHKDIIGNDIGYFYTKTELETADVITIDPENLNELCELFPEQPFFLINLVADNKNRLIGAVKNADDKITTESDFVDLCETENDAFCKFEDKLVSGDMNIPNIYRGNTIVNDFTEKSEIFKWADAIKTYQLVFSRFSQICNELAENKIIAEKDGKYLIHNNDNDTTTAIAKELFIEMNTAHKEVMNELINIWLTLKNTSFKDRKET